MALDFKRACIRALIVAQRYCDASRVIPSDEPFLSPARITLQLGNSGINAAMKAFLKRNRINYDPYSAILSAMIVPGGRYLVVLQKAYLTMWDLHCTPSTRPVLRMLHGVPQNSAKICNMSVDGSRTIQVLLRVLSHDPLTTYVHRSNIH